MRLCSLHLWTWSILFCACRWISPREPGVHGSVDTSDASRAESNGAKGDRDGTLWICGRKRESALRVVGADWYDAQSDELGEAHGRDIGGGGHVRVHTSVRTDSDLGVGVGGVGDDVGATGVDGGRGVTVGEGHGYDGLVGGQGRTVDHGVVHTGGGADIGSGAKDKVWTLTLTVLKFTASSQFLERTKASFQPSAAKARTRLRSRLLSLLERTDGLDL